jgi:uncharacterized membrane protein YphA (DoxX/SURF4 family)
MIQLTSRRRNLIVELISFLLILLFVYAAANKLMDLNKFRITIGQSPLLAPFSQILAWAIPVVEIIISVFLSTTKFRSIGLYLSFCLMVLFTAYVFVVMHLAAFVPCSCGGILETLSWEQHLWFNLVFVLLAIIGVLMNDSKKVYPYDQKTLLQ